MQSLFREESEIFILNAENFYKPLSDAASELFAAGAYSFDTPDAYDFELLEATLYTLKNSEEGTMHAIPVYDLISHQRVTDANRCIAKPRILLVEGIFVLFQKSIRDLIDMKVFVDVASDVRLARRVQREISVRNRGLQEILAEYLKFVKPGFDDFIWPTKKYADIVIPRGSENTVAINLLSEHVRGILDGTHSGCPTQNDFSVANADGLSKLLFQE